MSSKTVCIHIFRRDYRLYDNTALIEACKTYDIVVPIFIFTKVQITENPLRSDNAVQFLCESLRDLGEQLHEKGGNLFTFYGDDFSILGDIVSSIGKIGGYQVKCVSFNKDMTAYSQKRDAKIREMMKKVNIDVLELDDITLHPLGTVTTNGGKMYSKFTPYWRAASSIKVDEPIANSHKNYQGICGELARKLLQHSSAITMEDIMKPDGQIMGKVNEKLPERGGRANGLKILAKMGMWRNYDDMRDELIYNTTHLSPFNKFGCVSIREVYHSMVDKLGSKNGVIRQLFWRDFFYNLSALHPEIYKGPLNTKFAGIKWENDPVKFKAWCEGRTGFPVVDAAMREINETGYMHNRGRLIVSNFLVRLLQVDWRMGEHYFAKKLYDYDPAQNNFGWQTGAATTPTISRPLAQTILNPWIQSSNFDKDAEYIKKWLPELKEVTASHLHKWDEHCDEWLEKGVKYIKPIIDYKLEKEKNLKLYAKYVK